MEEKKELLIKVLKKLEGYWDETNNFLLLLSSHYATPELIDALIVKFSNAIKTSKQNEDKKTMLKGLEAIKKIKELEEKESISEEELDLLINGIE